MFQQWRACFLVVVALAVLLGNCQEEDEDGDEMTTTTTSELPDPEMADDMPTTSFADDEYGEATIEDAGDSMPMEGDDGPPALTTEDLGKIHSKMDADKDGKVSLKEMSEFASELKHSITSQENISDLAEMYDANQDGKVEFQEFLKQIAVDQNDLSEMSPTEKHGQDMWQQNDKDRFKAADRNGDDILEGEELRFFFHPEIHDEVLTMLAASTMKRRDRDGDGKLTPLEHRELEEDVQDEFHDPDEFNHADADNDGYLSLQELKAYEAGSHHEEYYMNFLFEAADVNKDKLLTLAELQAEYDKDTTADHVQHFEFWRSEL